MSQVRHMTAAEMPSSTTAAALGGCILVLLPLASYAMHASYASQKRREERQATSTMLQQKEQEALEGVRGQMRQWYEAYAGAIKERDALAARLQDPDEELQNLFSENALQDPNNPAPNRRAGLAAQYKAAADRATALQTEGERLKRAYDAMDGDKSKAD